MLWAAATLSVAVTVETPPFSAIGEVADKLTIGPASSSTSVIVWLCVPFSLTPLALLTVLISSSIVSVPSTRASLIRSIVVVAVVLPALITSELLMSV